MDSKNRIFFSKLLQKSNLPLAGASKIVTFSPNHSSPCSPNCTQVKLSLCQGSVACMRSRFGPVFDPNYARPLFVLCQNAGSCACPHSLFFCSVIGPKNCKLVAGSLLACWVLIRACLNACSVLAVAGFCTYFCLVLCFLSVVFSYFVILFAFFIE